MKKLLKQKTWKKIFALTLSLILVLTSSSSLVFAAENVTPTPEVQPTETPEPTYSQEQSDQENQHNATPTQTITQTTPTPIKAIPTNPPVSPTPATAATNPTPTPDASSIVGPITISDESTTGKIIVVPTNIPKISLAPISMESGKIRRAMSLRAFSKKLYQANEAVVARLTNASGRNIKVFLTHANGVYVNPKIEKEINGEDVIFKIKPPSRFKPGKYILRIVDPDTNQTIEQDFTWGVLAINTNKSIYLPNETANLSFAVLNERGNMVCDADLTLKITSEKAGVDDELSTKNGDITSTPFCQKKAFTLTPDFLAEYQIGKVGQYHLELTAKTLNGTYTISDSFQVQNSVDFDVERTTATRIYPPETYPVTLKIKAEKDFSGTVIETVPHGFDISPLDEKEIKKFDKIEIQSEELEKSTSDTQPEENAAGHNIGDKKLESENILGTSVSNLQLPFTGDHPITQEFGAISDNPMIQRAVDSLGIKGHDGVDFDMDIGTPLYAVDEGEVVVAGDGFYGVTVVLSHGWGDTYYGHLNKVKVEAGQKVEKGEEIGLSGNTGLSTGPHLHFSLRPKNFDPKNGYLGKVDPLPYLGLKNAKKDDVLGITTTSSLTKTINWNVEVKKGDEITLGYKFKSPSESPQFYLLGPLQFKDKNSEKIFEEQRQWQIAADQETQVIFDTAGSTSWTVPTGVTTIEVKAWGGGGGGGAGGSVSDGGNGGGAGYSTASIGVTPAESLTVTVGDGGTGGSYAGSNSGGGGGGGGRSEVLRSSTSLIIAAGGGGGGGGDNSSSTDGGSGGPGGGNSADAGGSSSSAGGGGGGNQSSGGAAGTGGNNSGTAGGLNYGGNGGNGGYNGSGAGGGAAGGSPNGGNAGIGSSSGFAGGGGGGDGRYGGGGGSASLASNAGGGGGGGGSAYLTGSSTSTTAGNSTDAGNNGDSDYADNAGQGGNGGGTTSAGDDGNPGRIVFAYDEPPNAPTLSETPAFANKLFVDSYGTVLGNFAATDNEGQDVDYQIQWDDDYNFGSATTKSSSDYPSDAGWSAATFSSGASTSYTVQSSDALTTDTTYWWRVRARDPAGSNGWGDYSEKRSFSVDTSYHMEKWYQTTDEQFDTDTLSGASTSGSDSVGLETGGYVESVEYVEITFGSSDASDSASLSKGQNIANCVPFVTKDVEDTTNYFDELYFDVFFDNPPKVIGSRTTATVGLVTLGITVVEFKSDITVQQGTFSISSGSGSGTASISTVDQSASALTFAYKTSGTGSVSWGNAAIRGYFSSNTQLTFDRDTNQTGSISGHYFVFEATGSEFSVQSTALTIAAYSTYNTATITEVDTDKTFLISSYRTVGQINDIQNFGAYVNLLNSTTIEAERDYNPPGSLEMEVFSIEFSSDGPETVQRGINSYGSGDAYFTDTITEVDTNKAMPWNPNYQGLIMCDGSAQGAEESGFHQLTLTDSTTVRGDRTSGYVAEGGWEVIEWYTDSTTGTVMSTAVDYDWLGDITSTITSWDEFSWNTDTTNGSVSFQVYYKSSTDCDTIIPDVDLTDNSTGFTSSPVDISGLNTTTYNRICLKATLTYSGGTPYLEDWTVKWNEGPLNANLMRHGTWFNYWGRKRPMTF